MAGNRTLKLSILADADDLRKKLTDSSKDVETFGDKVSDFGKKAGLAFAAAGAAAAAYAGKLLIDGVKSAIEDEAAQAKLAGTLERVAGASEKTVAAVESYITKTSLAVGVTDEKLRPSFDRLVRSTSDVDKAQTAMNLALDISARTGKSLETVTAAVGKALDGNATSLGKIAGGFEASELKGKSFADLLPILTERFGGAAQEQAETFAGKMDRLKIAFDEAKETAGSFILDAITPLVTKFVDEVIPAIQTFADELGPKLTPIVEAIGGIFKDIVLPALKAFWSFLSETVIPAVASVVVPALTGLRTAFGKIAEAVSNNKEEFEAFKPVLLAFGNFIKNTIAPILGGAFKTGLTAIGTIVAGLVSGFAKLAGFIGDAYDALVRFINLVKNNPIVKGISGLIDKAFGGGRATGGAVNSAQSYLVGERGPELFVPNTSGRIIPNSAMSNAPTINLNVSGAIDPEGTARTIIKVLNDSFARGTLGSLAFRS